jgi:hypothetical protein
MRLLTTPLLHYSQVQASGRLSDLSAVAQHMYSLMLRTIASQSV